MASSVSRLRRWFAWIAILMVATVAGMYFYAQWSLRKAVHTIPAKLGLDIQQTAEGFSISKSTEGRTQFTVSASKAVQFKEGGRAELHNVKIVIYGKDASRFDRITGDDFEYDPSSGNVNAKGTVLIDLEANPEGMQHSDQSPPERTKEPIHLETNGLVFNKNTGDASATGNVVFQTPQASGSAVGVQYVAKTGTMNLLSAVVMTVNRPQPVHLNADRGVITKQPHQVFLTAVHMTRELQEAWSDQATFFLREDNTVDHILAEGDVRSEIHGRSSSNSKTSNSNSSETRERSDRAELFLAGTRNLLTTALLSGHVQLANQEAQNNGTHENGAQPAEAAAGRVTLHFAGQQILRTVHAEDGVRLSQKNSQGGVLVAVASPSPAKGGAQSQDIEMTAPVMDFIVKDGRLLERAETSGPPRIVITQPGANQKTVVTAVKFTARFTEKNRISTLHGEPDAKIVSGLLDPGKSDLSKSDVSKADPTKAGSTKTGAAGQTDRIQSDRVSTSKMLDVVFLPEGGVRSITQTDGLAYVDGPQKAWAQRGEYTTADQMLVLSGSPRVVDTGMTTTAQTIRMNRATGDALAEGNVKSTYSDLKVQPDGAMLASSDPIHVTSRSMTAHRSAAIAVYTGDARLWQDANVVEAPTLQFDRDHRSLIAQGIAQGVAQATAHGESSQPVSTVLVQVDKTGKVTPVHITSARLNYADVERRIFLDGGVTAKASDATMTGERMTVFLLPRIQSQAGANPAMPGQVDRIIVEDKVVMTQPTRHATGDRLVYTSADDKFVLTGGPPSIFDAERGKTTGDSLTFYRHDDRVLVEGRGTSPAVTRTQVAR
ncbi:MAG: LPS export ABC transporter periplasmic protein LptC [Terriglobales bacterium]|jgi:lipopolysaccharide export system protein LptA